MFFKHFAKTENVCKNSFFGHKQCLQLLQNTVWRPMHWVIWDILLTRRPRQDDRNFPDDIFKRIFLNKNLWIFIKILLKFVPRVQLTIFQHLFRKWLGTGQATSHYLNQWWLFYWLIYASLDLIELAKTCSHTLCNWLHEYKTHEYNHSFML